MYPNIEILGRMKSDRDIPTLKKRIGDCQIFQIKQLFNMLQNKILRGRCIFRSPVFLNRRQMKRNYSDISEIYFDIRKYIVQNNKLKYKLKFKRLFV